MKSPASGTWGGEREQGFLIRVQLLVDDELLKPIYSSALNGRQTIMANAALTSDWGGKRTLGMWDLREWEGQTFATASLISSAAASGFIDWARLLQH